MWSRRPGSSGTMRGRPRSRTPPWGWSPGTATWATAASRSWPGESINARQGDPAAGRPEPGTVPGHRLDRPDAGAAVRGLPRVRAPAAVLLRAVLLPPLPDDGGERGGHGVLAHVVALHDRACVEGRRAVRHSRRGTGRGAADRRRGEAPGPGLDPDRAAGARGARAADGRLRVPDRGGRRCARRGR